MLTLDALRGFGANVDEGLGRCMNNEAFYLRLVSMGLNDNHFEKLAAAMEASDAAAAFDAAHVLKGVMGNLSLKPIYDPVCELTEILRGGDIVAGRDACARVLTKLGEGRKLLD